MSAIAELPTPAIETVTAVDALPARATWTEAFAVSALLQATCVAVLYLGAATYPTRIPFHEGNRFAGPKADLKTFYEEYASNQAAHGRSPMVGIELDGPLAWLRPLVRWDSIWFLSVAEVGYVADPKFPVQQNVAFYPLYPLLIRGLAVTGLPKPLCAVLLSNLATLLTAGCLFRLAANQFGLTSARWTLWLWLGYPTAMFGSVAYSDSLLSLLTVGALAALHKDRPLATGLLAGLATACRAPGLSLACLLVPGVFTRKWWQHLLALPLSVAGISGYFAWLGWQFGDPLLYPKVIRSWRPQDNLHPLRLLRSLVGSSLNAALLVFSGGERLFAQAIQVVDPLLLGWTLCWAWSVRRLGWGPFLCTSAAMGLALSAGGVTSYARYSWAMLPIFLVAGDSLSRSAWRWPVLFASLALQWWLAYLFGGGWEVI